MAKKTKIELLRERIKGDLLDQLERNGTNGGYYTDLVDDYMNMWDTKCGLINDITARGAKVLIVTGAGANLKTNDSIPDLLKVNAQMLKLLDSMGIKPSQAEPTDDEM